METEIEIHRWVEIERERDGRGGEREGGEKEWWEERIIETERGRKTKGSGDAGRKVRGRYKVRELGTQRGNRQKGKQRQSSCLCLST